MSMEDFNLCSLIMNALIENSELNELLVKAQRMTLKPWSGTGIVHRANLLGEVIVKRTNDSFILAATDERLRDQGYRLLEE